MYKNFFTIVVIIFYYFFVTFFQGDAITNTRNSNKLSNLSTNPILPGSETLIEIDKTGRGLGLSIVGGTDTILGVIVIHEIYPDGAAAKDGRLQPWDQIVEVMLPNYVSYFFNLAT